MYKLEYEMPYTELLKWISFFRKRPIGWREDQRAYMLLAAQGVKEKPERLFPALAIIRDANRPVAKEGAVPSGKFLENMLKARGGDSSGWKPNWGE